MANNKFIKVYVNENNWEIKNAEGDFVCSTKIVNGGVGADFTLKLLEYADLGYRVYVIRNK